LKAHSNGSDRPGGIRDSLADISKAQASVGFSPSGDIEADLRENTGWIKSDEISKYRLELV